ncbi:DNA-3-methyladenine glycosylase I [Naasia aerilata]|uniref:DNA-3-methyladenine glycosylase I n=2 Tax=Naasia aerilata TaxID=1162966 RepID=A0ABM8G7Q6_9MICO|nr:DNA-3-methyladenine glycosylase I [Naasia aerilata]
MILPAPTLLEMTTTIGEDGLARCPWATRDAEYRRYHDEEWGTPLHGDGPLFEKLCLEGFQAGLSWITILRRRPGFREAFSGFDASVLADWTEPQVELLLADTRIIRNRAKIEATLANARVLLDLQRDEGDGALDRLIWGFAPPAREDRPQSLEDIPAVTPESTALSKELRRRGFRFVGPTTVYALMQSAGLVDDHLAGCWRAGVSGEGAPA